MPESIENDELVEAAEAVVAESAGSIEADAPLAEQADTDSAEAEADADAEPTVTFADLGLPEGIVRKLAQNGVTAPFPIQAATIPDALAEQGHPGPRSHRLRQDPLLRSADPGHAGRMVTPRRRSPARSSSPRPVSSRCRSRTRSSRTATCSA